MLKNKSKKMKIGITLLIIGFAMYGVAALIGFLPLALKLKGIIIGSVLVFGEINILVSIVLLGKQVVKKYKSKLNPKNWFKKKETVVTEATEVNIEKATDAPHNETQADQTTVIELKSVKKGSRKHDTIKPNTN